jgi:serine/threonine-protein kinase HipA
MSQIRVCLAAAISFKLNANEAQEIIDRQVDLIKQNWKKVCDEAKLTKLDRQMFWERQFMNPYVFE